MVNSGWKQRTIQVTYYCPSREFYKEKIKLLQQKLSEMENNELQWKRVAEIEECKFTDPVLFISHRWETKDCPDPDGNQLAKLSSLKNCFIIYDYSSFPQLPRSELEEIAFQNIMRNMDKLILNVVVLHDRDYLERGWCVYEYLVSSLKCSVVCDEVQNPAFVSLRDWVSTSPPLSLSFRDSFESMQQNYINEKILNLVNEILPIYTASHFRTEYDSTYVTALLQEYLLSSLPNRKQHQPYVSEWKVQPWAKEELAEAFEKQLKLPRIQTLPIKDNQTNVPNTIEAAVDKDYRITRKLPPGPHENVLETAAIMLKSLLEALLPLLEALLSLGMKLGEYPIVRYLYLVFFITVTVCVKIITVTVKLNRKVRNLF